MRDVVPSNIPVWRWYQIKRGIIIFFKAPKKVVKHLKYEPCPIRTKMRHTLRFNGDFAVSAVTFQSAPFIKNFARY